MIVGLALVLLSSVVPCALLLVAKTYLALIATALILGVALSVVAPVYIALMADRVVHLSNGLIAEETRNAVRKPPHELSW